MLATIYELSELRSGDRIISVGPASHINRPLVVERELDYIAPGSPVRGVRCGILAGGVEMVLYPSQCDGLPITIELPL